MLCTAVNVFARGRYRPPRGCYMRQSFSSGCKRGWLSSGEDASGMKIVLTSVETCPKVYLLVPETGTFLHQRGGFGDGTKRHITGLPTGLGGGSRSPPQPCPADTKCPNLALCRLAKKGPGAGWWAANLLPDILALEREEESSGLAPKLPRES